ncbi:MAG: methylated-DNA--[protein]-cysteine S-methyltransferase [Chlamydiales bacterium]
MKKLFDCNLPLDIIVTVNDGKIVLTSCKHSTQQRKLSCTVVGSPDDEKVSHAIFSWLDDYTRKIPPKIALPFKLPERGFSYKVLEQLQKIPFGKTCSYKEIALNTGTPMAARAVGSACGANPFPLFIPCHRVIKTNGTIGGFAFGPAMKKLLLDFER